MPHISNEDLLELMQRILQRVDTIEGKLDLLLEDKIKATFTYQPINTDEELERVSKRIISDKQYKQNLRNHMQSKGFLRIEHLFTGEFLTKGHSLEKLVPFNEIYVHLKMKSGQTLEEIANKATVDLACIKQRVRIEQRNNLDKELDTEMIILDHDYIKLEEEWEPEKVLIEMSTIYEPTLKTEYNEQETQEESSDDDDNDDPDEEFQPIGNDQELKRVSRKIKNNPLYLQNLRIQIVEESEDGICTLRQLFTPDFLRKTFVKRPSGDNKRITDLVPYKTVYHYLRKNLGHSLLKIEKDAILELKMVKQRVRARDNRNKKRDKFLLEAKQKRENFI